MDKEQQRAAFEKWLREHTTLSRQLSEDGQSDYFSHSTELAWIGWQAAIEQASQPQWIPVTERKPEDGQEVLALVAGKRHVLAFHVETVAYVANRFGHTYWSRNGERIWATPTHWMPLPEASENA